MDGSFPDNQRQRCAYRAHRQKMQLRALRAAQAHAAGVNLLPHDGVHHSMETAGASASGFGRQRIWSAGLRLGRRPRHRGRHRSRRRHGQYGLYRRSIWRSLEVHQCRAAQPKSFKCYLDSADRRSTHARCGLNRHPASTDQPRSGNSVVLVGTGETNSSGDSYYGLGILRSADAGNSWTLISQDASGTHPLPAWASARSRSAP